MARKADQSELVIDRHASVKRLGIFAPDDLPKPTRQEWEWAVDLLAWLDPGLMAEWRSNPIRFEVFFRSRIFFTTGDVAPMVVWMANNMASGRQLRLSPWLLNHPQRGAAAYRRLATKVPFDYWNALKDENEPF